MSRTAGYYKRGPGVGHGRGGGRAVRPVLEPLPQEATEHALPQMIHAWVDLVLQRRESHGPLFRARMAAINAAQDRFRVQVRHRYGSDKASALVAVCPRCESRYPYRRRVTNAACRRCLICTTGGSGMPAACSVTSRRIEMDVFWLSLELGGVAIALIGLRRERWLRQRRR